MGKYDVNSISYVPFYRAPNPDWERLTANLDSAKRYGLPFHAAYLSTRGLRLNEFQSHPVALTNR